MVRKEVANHQSVAHAATTLERIRLVRDGAALTGRHKVFGAAYRPLNRIEPSPTVTRSGFRDFIHPEEDRCCTVRELARLQTFPDSYVFEGRRCDTYARSRYVKQTQHEQVGNAVPPLLAQRLAAAIRSQLLDTAEDGGATRKQQRRFDPIFQLLHSHYPEDRLGNKKNPLDELIYILLSRRAREAQYQQAYNALARRFRPWSTLLEASSDEVITILRPLGLASQRERALIDVLGTIRADFGRLSLSALRRMSYSGAYNYLRSLRGVNDKTAKCVMLYSLGMPALPVDTHTLRVSRRLGLLPPGTSLFLAPRRLDAIVPRSYRGRFHILTVLHGRALCTPQNPECSACPVRALCPTGRARSTCDERLVSLESRSK
jgi:endonuclease III